MTLDRWLLLVASAVGVLISIGFVLMARGKVSPRRTFLLRFCRLEEASCTRILSTPEARLFSVPNYWMGLVYYTLLLVASTSQSLLDLSLFGFFFASLITVAVGIYLTYILLVKL